MNFRIDRTRRDVESVASNIKVSEVLGFESSRDGRGGWALQSMGATSFTAKWEPNATGVGVDPETGESMPKMERIALCDFTQIAQNDPLFCEVNRFDDQVWVTGCIRLGLIFIGGRPPRCNS